MFEEAYRSLKGLVPANVFYCITRYYSVVHAEKKRQTKLIGLTKSRVPNLQNRSGRFKGVHLHRGIKLRLSVWFLIS